MLEKYKPFLIAILTAVLTALGIRIPDYYLTPPTPAAPPTAPAPVQPPAPTPPPQPQPNTPAALGRIQFGNAGCTATVIGPRRDDGKYWVLTAAHCVEGVGQRGTMRLLDGRTLGVQVASLDRRADCCWLVTDTNTETLPFALLADSDPTPGTKIWHAGYGVDHPGNREEGEVVAQSNSDGQLQFRLSVSSGDSGGGICIDADNKVVSCVCCTTAKGRKADVWGAGPAAIRRAKPSAMVLDDWKPLDIPIRPLPANVPQQMPEKK